MSRIDAELKQRLNYEIMTLERAKHEYSERLYHLRDYQGAYIRWADHGSNKYYYVKRSGSASYKYVGKSGLHDVQKIKEIALK